MNKVLILGLLLLLMESCLKPALDDLEFFEVKVDPPVAVAVGELTLKGNITALKSLDSKVDACGFYYAETVAALTNQITNADSIQSAVPVDGNDNFESQFKGLLQGQTLYFRSFARKGKRTVYSDDVVSYGFGQLVNLVNAPSKQNDTMTVLGQVSGISAQHLDADGYGHVYSSLHKLPEVGALGCDANDLGPLNDDLIYTSRIPGLDFNTKYYVRAYLRVGQKFYYSASVDSILIEDGWKPVTAFPFPYQGGSGQGVDSKGKAFVGFGCDDNDCLQNALPENFISYTPGVDSGTWEDQAPFNLGFKCMDATMFRINDSIYVFGGEANTLGGLIFAGDYFKRYNIDGNSWLIKNDPIVLRRSKAIAFVLNNKAYVGTGRVYDPDPNNTIHYKQVNDFWEYDPANDTWRQVASLPQKIGMDPESYDGREDAVVFSDENNAYVGGGSVNGAFLKDFWQFTPPQTQNPQDTGKWTFVNFFPGLGRTEAVCFSINHHGYYGMGNGGNGIAGNLSDFWEFDFSNYMWERKKNDFPGGRREKATYFTLLNKGYVLGGIKSIVGGNGASIDVLPVDCWQYTPKQ